ncbi:alpha/beta fold hydrolase [Saccharothrix obliqua]|uniref:alpha/beta fold hydrolase n=1 Tax=Saccharothrix obliqua TaxID=2861747 RepID=UPI001C5DC1CB|nr:alpha/beta fold hydrolase [Saccharothrix obliqua]MBW4718431.1 lysophospholipase [Saccharothrix obliqua]
MGEFAGRTGTIHFGRWSPPEPSALVVFLHGLGEHIGSYDALAAALGSAGFAFWAHDHAGHGRSEGVRVLVDSVDDLVADAATSLRLARAEHPGLPVVLAGHSLGATVAALLTAEQLVGTADAPDALVLSGASLLPGYSPLAALLASGVDPWDLRKDPGELTRHPAHAQRIREDPLTWQGGLRRETLHALTAAAPRLHAAVGALRLPVLLLHGAEDDIASAEHAVRAAEELPDGHVTVFPDDRHNVLNELDRDDVHRVFAEFVAAHTG